MSTRPGEFGQRPGRDRQKLCFRKLKNVRSGRGAPGGGGGGGGKSRGRVEAEESGGNDATRSDSLESRALRKTSALANKNIRARRRRKSPRVSDYAACVRDSRRGPAGARISCSGNLFAAGATKMLRKGPSAKKNKHYVRNRNLGQGPLETVWGQSRNMHSRRCGFCDNVPRDAAVGTCNGRSGRNSAQSTTTSSLGG